MFVNLTQHTITIFRSEGEPPLVIHPSGIEARVASSRVPDGEIEGVTVFRTVFGELTGLPDPVPGTTFVASLFVRQAAEALGRTDVLSPGVLVRDDNGQPTGCRGLARG